jgi:hypothetical protein
MPRLLGPSIAVPGYFGINRAGQVKVLRFYVALLGFALISLFAAGEGVAPQRRFVGLFTD